MPETENGKTLAISAWAPATSNRRSLYRSHLPWEEGDCQVGKWNSRLVSPHPSQTIIPPESNISKCSTRLKETVTEGRFLTIWVTTPSTWIGGGRSLAYSPDVKAALLKKFEGKLWVLLLQV